MFEASNNSTGSLAVQSIPQTPEWKKNPTFAITVTFVVFSYKNKLFHKINDW